MEETIGKCFTLELSWEIDLYQVSSQTSLSLCQMFRLTSSFIYFFVLIYFYARNILLKKAFYVKFGSH